jgi:anti-sigma factor RsiW
MDCTEVRDHLIDLRRGTLTGELRAQVELHMAECERCRTEDAADRELSAILESRLPKRRAPEAVRRSIEERLAGEEPRATGRVRKMPRALMLAVAGTFAAAAALFFFVAHDRSSSEALYAEAVNDHLRVLYAERPIEIESGGVHQVKPWFAGRLDFAPVMAFGGDDDFPLQGGAVAYFLDRKAAAFEFKRRLHPITLFVFRADGLPWSTVPTASSVSLGHLRATERTTRGFHVLLWRDGDLGYALVSDLDPRELATLAGKIAGG